MMTILVAVLSRSSACVQILPMVEAHIPYFFCRTGVIKTGEAGTPCSSNSGNGEMMRGVNRTSTFPGGAEISARSKYFPGMLGG
jgi:hypothetical protein